MSDANANRPKRCPACGSRDVRERRETGGGWRRVFRCGECGTRVTPGTDENEDGD